MIDNNFRISSQLHQTHWSNGDDGHIVHENVHVDVHDNVHDDVLEDVHDNVHKFSMNLFLDALASLGLTYKVSQKNMAVACCHSSATAVFLLGHSVCKVLDTIVQKLINFKDFKVCDI